MSLVATYLLLCDYIDEVIMICSSDTVRYVSFYLFMYDFCFSHGHMFSI